MNELEYIVKELCFSALDCDLGDYGENEMCLFRGLARILDGIHPGIISTSIYNALRQVWEEIKRGHPNVKHNYSSRRKFVYILYDYFIYLVIYVKNVPESSQFFITHFERLQELLSWGWNVRRLETKLPGVYLVVQ